MVKLSKVIDFLNKEFNLLDKKKDRYLLILICFVFSIIFLNVFVPFNINRWYSDSGIIQFLRLSSYGVVVSLILLFTQFPLRKIFKVNFFKVKTFLLWLSIEIILISLVYIFLYGNPLGNFINDLGFSVKYTLLGICLPYSFSLLFIHYKNQYIEMELLREQILKPIPDRFIVLRDEKGKIRFSVLARDLLFLESADNYVIVNYLLNGKPKRKILRNTLKNLENILKQNSILRCHRSFIVNMVNIEMMEKKGKGGFLKLKSTEMPVPVSQKYYRLFLENISST